MTSSMRVMHLGKFYPPAPGGIESLVRDLAIAQSDHGMDVSAQVFHHEPGHQTTSENDNGVRVVRHARTAGFAKLDYSSNLIDQIRYSKADILHLHVPNPSMILALLKVGHKFLDQTPIVVTYHSDIVRQKLRAAVFRPFENRLYSYVSAICPTSPMYANGSRFLRNNRTLIRPVPLGLNLDRFLNPTPEDLRKSVELKASAQGPIWLACGRLVYYKGFLTAIRALARTRSGGELWIIGTGSDLGALKTEVEKLNLTDRVKFLGQVPSTVPYYHASDAFWFPSNARSEAFGLVQVEAMASGCPIINTSIPNSGVAWVSQNDLTGFTVPVDDPDALAQAADRIANEPLTRERFAINARRRAFEQFDIRVMARRNAQVYDVVLGRSSSEPSMEPQKLEKVVHSNFLPVSG